MSLLQSLSRLSLFAALALAGCNGSSTPPDGGAAAGATALYDTGATKADFFAAPWPSDDRLDGDGHQVVDGFLAGTNAPTTGVVPKYVAAVAGEPLHGFGTQSAVYFRFDGALDASSLPADAAASTKGAASAFVVAVGATASAWTRAPLRARFVAEAGTYIGANWLALLPEPGFPLAEGATYLAVVTDGVKARDGSPVKRPAAFASDAARVLGGAGATELGVDPAHVVVATRFTTQQATPIMKQLREAVYATPVPTVSHFGWKGVETKTARFDLFTGTYDAPNFQEGTVPYTSQGGHIHLGSDGKPAPVRTETLRFALTVPHGVQMPAAGWPIVLYAHGTGGDFESFVGDGSAGAAANVVDAQGKTIANLAMISIDQVLHGPRDPTHSDPEITFFNLINPVAARDNPKQGALDDFSLLRFVEAFSVDMAPTTNAPIKFDKDRVYFKGHSQGGLTGPLFLAYEPDVKAAVLSGAGGNFMLSLLNKKAPNDIPAAVEALVGEPVDAFHPLLNLLQGYLESSDPSNYGRLFFRAPPTGQAPKSIYQSLGVVDHYTPIPTIQALALAMAVPPAQPMVVAMPDLDLAGLSWLTPPVVSNVAGGAATGVLCQYTAPMNDDGHFVVFDVPAAVRQANGFLATHAATGTATLLP